MLNLSNQQSGDITRLGIAYGAELSFLLSEALKDESRPVMVIVKDMAEVARVHDEIAFYCDDSISLQVFPDWETLPYDHFSPHQDITSDRLRTLYNLPSLTKAIIIVPISTLLKRIAPREHVALNSFVLACGDQVEIEPFRKRLQEAGYHATEQVMEHGEYAVRGAIIDLFPMGSKHPFRIDLFDNEVDTIRSFHPDTQRSLETFKHVELLPAHEFLLNEQSIADFRQAWRENFAGNPTQCPIYEKISAGRVPGGIEYYLPLFHQQMMSLLDYLPNNTVLIRCGDIKSASEQYWQEIKVRYEQMRFDVQRPILPPEKLFIQTDDLLQSCKRYAQLRIVTKNETDLKRHYNLNSHPLPELSLNTLAGYINQYHGRILLCAETLGRREMLLQSLQDLKLNPKIVSNWQAFLAEDSKFCLTVADIDYGFVLSNPDITVITETLLFGEKVMQRRYRTPTHFDPDTIIRDLTELNIGNPVVHLEHGVGRYLGLETIKSGDVETEYLVLEYAGNDKLFVPVSSLELISRYTGGDLEHAPLDRLGSNKWQKAKKKAREKIQDVAAELLDIYAQRAAKPGFRFQSPHEDYQAFCDEFPFEETQGQMDAIEQVIADMVSPKSMDRLVCGDVGFGKTEVALRAAFIAANSAKQVAVLVPTTLLAEQHYQTFINRFAKWPFKIEVISRMRSSKEQNAILQGMKNGTVDIVIGTHKLLQKDIAFKNLGLLVVDEEHRFGVKQKEKIKSWRADIDILTLTATPIPRTLNMALAGTRDLSIINTPPQRRLAIKTFVHETSNSLIREAVLREIYRGGQVFFMHNKVQTIEARAEEIGKLIPEASIAIAHGQMHEKELEQVMRNFYHQKFTVLVCTTIIESGIDIPTANTIIIDRADRFGLAQLHQIRGRVGRSHHQAYAYLMIPAKDLITKDAEKRLEAISSIEDLGAGFALATHDLEIRGAGEMLGEGQSGHIAAIGFTLYLDLLEKTVKALREGKDPAMATALDSGCEIDLSISAIIPEDYIPDVHTRLTFYKRIANAQGKEQLNDLQVEMVDRFGLLDERVLNLFKLTEYKHLANLLGIKRIRVTEKQGTIEFNDQPNINVAELIKLVQQQSSCYQLKGQQLLRFSLPNDQTATRFSSLQSILHTIKP